MQCNDVDDDDDDDDYTLTMPPKTIPFFQPSPPPPLPLLLANLSRMSLVGGNKWKICSAANRVIGFCMRTYSFNTMSYEKRFSNTHCLFITLLCYHFWFVSFFRSFFFFCFHFISFFLSFWYSSWFLNQHLTSMIQKMESTMTKQRV